MTTTEFDSWLKKIDKLLIKEIGLERKDLPDQDFWVLYNEDISFQDVTRLIINDFNYL